MSDVVAFIRSQMARFSEVPSDQVSATTRFADLPSWGSLPALQLLAAIEKEYSVSFEVREYLSIGSVGDLAEAIEYRVLPGRQGPDETTTALPVEA